MQQKKVQGLTIFSHYTGMINPSIDWTEYNSNMDIDEGEYICY